MYEEDKNGNSLIWLQTNRGEELFEKIKQDLLLFSKKRCCKFLKLPHMKYARWKGKSFVCSYRKGACRKTDISTMPGRREF